MLLPSSFTYIYIFNVPFSSFIYLFSTFLLLSYLFISHFPFVTSHSGKVKVKWTGNVISLSKGNNETIVLAPTGHARDIAAALLCPKPAIPGIFLSIIRKNFIHSVLDSVFQPTIPVSSRAVTFTEIYGQPRAIPVCRTDENINKNTQRSSSLFRGNFDAVILIHHF